MLEGVCEAFFIFSAGNDFCPEPLEVRGDELGVEEEVATVVDMANEVGEAEFGSV